MERGIKHLVKCRCILPQFVAQPDPPAHQFVVFSVYDDETDEVTPKFAQCNNCGIVHKVTELGASQVMQGRENLPSLVTIDEIKSSISGQLAALLESHSADLATWEQARWIVENQRWGDFVILTSDVIDGLRQGKVLRIIGERLFKVDSYTREEIFSIDTKVPR